MTKDQAKDLVKQNETIVVLFTYNILFTNDIVCSMLIESMDELKKSPLYRRETKMLANKADNARRNYERIVNEVIGDKSAFFADSNDTFCEELNRHVQVLFYCIKREFDKANIEHSDLIAKLETTRTLCEFSCQQFDQRMKELMNRDRRFSGFTLEYLRLTNVQRFLDSLIRTFKVPVSVNLNTTDCLAAIDVLGKKLINGDIIAKAISA